MFEIALELDDEQVPLSGFEMGNLSIRIDDVLIDSKAEGRHLMMLFLSLSELLGGLRHLFTSTTRAYEFVGVDSSFVLVFEKNGKDSINIKVRHKVVVSISRHELIQKLYSTTEEFWSAKKPLMTQDNVVTEDLDRALAEFEVLITNI